MSSQLSSLAINGVLPQRLNTSLEQTLTLNLHTSIGKQETHSDVFRIIVRVTLVHTLNDSSLSIIEQLAIPIIHNINRLRYCWNAVPIHPKTLHCFKFANTLIRVGVASLLVLLLVELNLLEDNPLILKGVNLRTFLCAHIRFLIKLSRYLERNRKPLVDRKLHVFNLQSTSLSFIEFLAILFMKN